MTIPAHVAAYNAQVVRVVDADTISLRLDKDHGTHFVHPRGHRLIGIDCPERFTEAGKEATQFVAGWIYAAEKVNDPWPFVAEGALYDKYGRPLSTIYRKLDGTSLTDSLLDAGFGQPISLAAQLPQED